jgi:hypothetical protein
MKLISTIMGTAVTLTALMVPLSAAAADTESVTETDHLLVDAQGICPVSGQKLGSHGDPVKATVGEQTVFLCCKGCVGKDIPKENWSKVLQTMAAAQGVCPVMKRALPKKPASLVVDGRTVFVCCKPCIAKVQADPKKYVAVVDQLLTKNQKADGPPKQ